MRLTCRSCGATGSAETVFGDADAADALVLAGQLEPATARVVWHYLALFRPETRALAWSRTARLLGEISELMAKPAIDRHGRERPVTQAMWREAMQQMVDGRERLVLPLKSHGYLLEIVAGLADKAEAAAERKREEQLRSGRPAATPQAWGVTRIDLAALELAGEHAARKRLGMPAMTPEEETAFLDRMRTTTS